MAGGRPTDYTPEIVSKARDYLSTYKDLGDIIPQIAGLAVYLRIARDTVYDWSKDPAKHEFSDIVCEILASQERNLVNGGVKGDFAPKITSMMLAKHGYAEKVQTEHSGRISTDMDDDELDRLIRERQQALEKAQRD